MGVTCKIQTDETGELYLYCLPPTGDVHFLERTYHSWVVKLGFGGLSASRSLPPAYNTRLDASREAALQSGSMTVLSSNNLPTSLRYRLGPKKLRQKL